MTSNDHYSRLKAMLDDNGQTWDLSPNDKKAVAWAIKEIDKYNLSLKLEEPTTLAPRKISMQSFENLE